MKSADLVGFHSVVGRIESALAGGRKVSNGVGSTLLDSADLKLQVGKTKGVRMGGGCPEGLLLS